MKTLIGHIRTARAAFTLMEVNLAIFIMAVGVLAMTSLYPLGFREGEQARDDVQAAVVADEVLGKLTAALSSRNITWDEWWKAVDRAVKVTDRGWFTYYGKKNDDTYVVKDRSSVNSIAESVFSELAKACNPKPGFDFSERQKYAYGIVAQWGKRRANGITWDDYSRVSISFRLARRANALMAAPVYYTEIHFQGDLKDTE